MDGVVPRLRDIVSSGTIPENEFPKGAPFIGLLNGVKEIS